MAAAAAQRPRPRPRALPIPCPCPHSRRAAARLAGRRAPLSGPRPRGPGRSKSFARPNTAVGHHPPRPLPLLARPNAVVASAIVSGSSHPPRSAQSTSPAPNGSAPRASPRPASCPGLADLDLSNGVDLGDTAAAEVARGKGLRRLSLARWKPLTDMGLECVAVGCTELRELSLPWGLGSGDPAPRPAWKLTSLDLSYTKHRDFVPQRHIQPATPLTSMAPPFPLPPGTPVIKVENERESDVPGQVTTNKDKESRDMLTKDVQRRLELIPSGSAQSQPPPAPPVTEDVQNLKSKLNNLESKLEEVTEDVQNQLNNLESKLEEADKLIIRLREESSSTTQERDKLQQEMVQQAPPLPPPPPPPAQHPCAKRPAIGPPPGFPGGRTPPLKQHQQRLPPGPKAPAQPQPALLNVHRAPAPPALDTQRAGHAPQPAPGAHGSATAVPPVHARPSAVQQRTTPKPLTVLCTLCGVLCMTAWHLKQHEEGRKHRNRVACLAGEMNVRCSVCDVQLSGGKINIKQHNAGKKHLQRLNRGA